MAIAMSSLREEKKIDKVNLTNALSELLGEMQTLNEQQRVGEPKRQNLETNLERLNRGVQGGNQKLGRRKNSLWRGEE